MRVAWLGLRVPEEAVRVQTDGVEETDGLGDGLPDLLKVWAREGGEGVRLGLPVRVRDGVKVGVYGAVRERVTEVGVQVLVTLLLRRRVRVVEKVGGVRLGVPLGGDGEASRV